MSKSKARSKHTQVQLPDPLPPLLSRPQLVKLIGLSYPSIWHRIRRGTFPAGANLAPRGTGHQARIMWFTTEILAWIDQQQKSAPRQHFAGADINQQAESVT